MHWGRLRPLSNTTSWREYLRSSTQNRLYSDECNTDERSASVGPCLIPPPTWSVQILCTIIIVLMGTVPTLQRKCLNKTAHIWSARWALWNSYDKGDSDRSEGEHDVRYHSLSALLQTTSTCCLVVCGAWALEGVNNEMPEANKSFGVFHLIIRMEFENLQVSSKANALNKLSQSYNVPMLSVLQGRLYSRLWAHVCMCSETVNGFRKRNNWHLSKFN